MKNQKENSIEIELTGMKIAQLNRQPIIETAISTSEDGKWLIHKTIITDLKPVSYFEKVLSEK